RPGMPLRRATPPVSSPSTPRACPRPARAPSPAPASRAASGRAGLGACSLSHDGRGRGEGETYRRSYPCLFVRPFDKLRANGWGPRSGEVSPCTGQRLTLSGDASPLVVKAEEKV